VSNIEGLQQHVLLQPYYFSGMPAPMVNAAAGIHKTHASVAVEAIPNLFWCLS